MTCNGIGGQPPATLAEFTLGGWGGSDFYDLSNVDGNTVSMTIRPIPGQYTSVNNPSLGKYNCGTVSCSKDSKTKIEPLENLSMSHEMFSVRSKEQKSKLIMREIFQSIKA
jgi:hypothetical protein